MIKRVATSELRVGMYVHDLDCGWMEHPFLTSRFAIKDEQVIRKMAAAGLRHVYIDTDRGGDDAAAQTVAQIDAALQSDLEDAAATDAGTAARVPVAAELGAARSLVRESTSVVRNLMAAARSGRQVELAAVDPLAERMVQSVFRNPHAVTSVARIKTADEYTFMHCVSVAALLVAFARELELPETQIREIAVGGLVHDIGKTLVPQDILNKPGKLTEAEFARMRDHVSFSRQLLEEVPDISQTALDVTLLHHERMDGRGYPDAIPGARIGLVGRMAAIVDVYDALTSVRVYKDAWEPTQAMKKLLEWSPAHFDRALVQRFARCIGIYPVGSAVALESGRVGIVLDQGPDLLRPLLRLVFNRKHQHFEAVRDIDLARHPEDRIVEAVDPADYGIRSVDYV